MPVDAKRVQLLFLEAVERPVAERAAFLQQSCGPDAEVRGRVEALLRASDDPGSFLETGAPDAAATGTFDRGDAATAGRPGREEGVGTVIAGKYKLIEAIGEGGMGSVFMAQQLEPVKRAVAVKVIKAGMDSKAVLARFEAERQALAMMDHPNIAKVLDGGVTEQGSPYFVMELVKGIPITKFCDDARLTPRQRLELFVPVCQAIQHAHQKGVIHRDIKPSNVLVAMYDDRPVPKVIDFGVAKAAGSPLTDRTLMTGYGAVVGTPEYMSPEQASFNQMDVDTRSDVYALGVLLYELLTGTTPVNRKSLGNAALLEVLRIVREVEAPTPSKRLSTTDALPSIAANRNVEPARLSRLMKGELDWIVMKALEKDRTRRYDTANGLAADVQRYLADEVVEARRPSTAYRLRKYVRRHRGPVIAAAVVLLALVGGVIGTARGLVEARRQRDAAELARKQEEAARNVATQQQIAASHNEQIANEQRAIAAKDRDRAVKALYFNGINLAHQYWLGNNLAQSNRILEASPAEARGWEWNYLQRLLHADLLTLPGNGQYTTALQFSRDGQRMAAVARYGDSGVRIWDLTTNKPISEIHTVKTRQVYRAAAFRHDGQTVALGEQSGTVTVWDANTGNLIREFQRLPRPASQLAFSPDGRWLAAAFAEGRNGEALVPIAEPSRQEDLIVWDAASGKEVFHPKGYGAVAIFSPDGSRLLTLRKNTAIRLTPFEPEFFAVVISTADWKETALEQFGDAECFSFSADGKQLALGGRDHKNRTNFCRIIDLATGKELSRFAPQAIGDIDLSPDGKTLAMTRGYSKGEIDLWELKSQRIVRTLRGHTSWCVAVSFAPDGRLVSCSNDNTIKFWNPSLYQDVARISEPLRLYARPTALSPDGSLMAFSESGTVNVLTGAVRSITLIDTNPGRSKSTLRGSSGGTISLAFSANGKRLASGGRSGEVKIWDLATNAEVCNYRGHDGQIAALALSPDGRWAASAHEPKSVTEARSGRGELKNIPISVKVWDAQTGKERWELKGHPSGVYQAAFSPDGRYLATQGFLEKYLAIGGYHRIKLWDMNSGVQVRELETSAEINGNDALFFSPTGDMLVFGGGNAVQFLSVATGQSAAIIHVQSSRIMGLAMSPDQSRLATASGREVKLWEANSGQEILTLPLPEAAASDRSPMVGALAWSADGQRLRAALQDGSIIEWNGRPKPAR